MKIWIFSGTRKLLTGQTAGSTHLIEEFRSKLRLAEDLISKLTFNVREIQGVWRKPKEVVSSDVAKANRGDVRPFRKPERSGAPTEPLPKTRLVLGEITRVTRKGQS